LFSDKAAPKNAAKGTPREFESHKKYPRRDPPSVGNGRLTL
jgi:hypothetical protein